MIVDLEWISNTEYPSLFLGGMVWGKKKGGPWGGGVMPALRRLTIFCMSTRSRGHYNYSAPSSVLAFSHPADNRSLHRTLRHIRTARVMCTTVETLGAKQRSVPPSFTKS